MLNFTDLLIKQARREIITMLKFTAQGKKNAVSNAQIRNYLHTQFYIDVDDAQVRAIIHDIRVSGDVKNILASRWGYYLSNDPVEIVEWVKRYKSKISKMDKVANSMLSWISEYM